MRVAHAEVQEKRPPIITADKVPAVIRHLDRAPAVPFKSNIKLIDLIRRNVILADSRRPIARLSQQHRQRLYIGE